MPTMTVVVRRLLGGLALVTLSAGAGSAQAAQNPASQATPARVAFIHARQVLRQMPGYARAESTWTKEAEVTQREMQRMQAAWDSTISSFRQASAMMTPSARTAREKSLQVQGDSLDAKFQGLRERIDARERELLVPMQTKLQAVIDGIRAEGGFTMVIDLDNPSSANIISFDKSLDISDRVARRALQSN
ncbi:MAG TPA: OmpH family outer membrane protein [Gemmatimonadales bacterium]|nr:OmpH family outer membrane protein [Gemmatimonadales bacterium]